MVASPALRATVSPARRLRGTFRMPGDKSISHRAALLAGMAKGESRLGGFSGGADCASTLACLRSLGVGVAREGDVVTVNGGLERFRKAPAPLDAGNSGSTLRMLLGVLAGRPFASTLTGDASLQRRPMERVAAPLRAMGAQITSVDGKPPVSVLGGRLSGLEHRLPVASAQVKTAILLAGLQAEGLTVVVEPAPSRDHTERLLPLFGCPVQADGLLVSVQGGSQLTGASFDVPGDPSSAAFLVVAALVTPDSAIRIEGVLLNPTRAAFLEVLKEMGADIRSGLTAQSPEPVGWIEARSSRLRGVAVDPARVPSLIDEVPILAVAGACCAEGTFSVSGAAELRVKESDRLAALAEGLSRMGASVDERPDGLVVGGGKPLHGAEVRSHGDHRIAMALAIAGLVASGRTDIEESECVGISYPEFFSHLEEARAT